MATLVFDIETVGDDWDGLDPTTQKTLTRWIDRTITDEHERSLQLRLVKERLGFSPLTGRVVSLAVYDVERALGSVYFVGGGTGERFQEGSYTYKERSEQELLEDLWETACSYDVFVTFNGRAFDVPFLLHRSVALAVQPTVTINQKRYLSQQSTPYHVDLLDQLTYYGAMGRRPSLQLFCHAYGIESPKSEMDGYQVAEFFHQKKFRDLARYNAADVIATTALYEKWKQYLAPRSWLNVIEY